MSDCGIVLRCYTTEEQVLADASGARIAGEPIVGENLVALLPQLRDALGPIRNTLDEEPDWKIVEPETITLFEYWYEASDSLVGTPDAGVALAPETEMELDGEMVMVPEIPENNPPADELFQRLLQMDLSAVEGRLRTSDLPAEILVRPEIAHW